MATAAPTRKSGVHPLPVPTEATSPWEVLKSNFLAARTPIEQVRIFDLSVRTATPLYQWAARYPLIRRVRVWPLALSVSAAGSFSTVEALVSTARLSLWVFTLDDVFDEEAVPEKELMCRAERYRAIAYGEPVPPARDTLAAALRDVRDDLARYPLFESLGIEWANALSGTIDGMIAEYRWRQDARSGRGIALPTYDEYVASGLYSIGGPPHVWGALITTDDASTPQHLDHLKKMERIACTCIRLANDLQSYRKELEEGNINALVILSQELVEKGLSQDEALQMSEALVRAKIHEGLRQLAELQAEGRTRTGRPEADIADIARFVCDFYSTYDYHTFVVP